MNVLALDAALGAFSAALAHDERIVASATEPGAVALERGLSIIATTLSAGGISAENVDRIAVGIGPGSFTGMRIAIAYAKSLAAAWERPLVPIDSFDLLEYPNAFPRTLSVVVGRPGVISARYRDDGATRRASGRVGEVLDELFGAGRGSEVVVVLGAPKDVLDALAERRIHVHPTDPAVTPAAAAAALAASSRVPATSVHEVTADYGELPAAKIPKLGAR
jgi:tRNA threonylcarbamoyladenosine biosynthesis protein TsaB